MQLEGSGFESPNTLLLAASCFSRVKGLNALCAELGCVHIKQMDNLHLHTQT